MNTFIFESDPWSHRAAIEFITPQMRTCANPKPRSQAGNAVVLRGALQEYKSSARVKARARTNVGQSVGPQPYRVGATVAARKASVAFARGLRLELGMQLFSPPELIGLTRTKDERSFCSDSVVEEKLTESLCHCLHRYAKKLTAA